MIIKSLTQEINEEMLLDVAQQRRAKTIEYYDRNYRELEGDVSAHIETYWPKKYNESDAAYAERVKIWTQLPKIIINRIVSLILSGEVKREWVSIDEKPSVDSERANQLDQLTNELNGWETRAQTIYYYALGIGEVAIWPEFRRFDKTTGLPYAIDNGQGVPVWTHWFPWFVEPIVLQDYAEEIIGAVKIIRMDGQQATTYLSEAIYGNDKRVITQAYAAPQYDRMTGDLLNGGFYRAWENGVEKSPVNESGGEDVSWRESNKFGCNPVVFFRGPDPDETQFRGKSFQDRFRDLAIHHTRFVSSIGQAIEILPNIWKYTGDQKNIDKVVLRSNSIVQIPTDGVFEQATRALDLSEDWKLVNYIEKLISLAAALPAEVWDTLGSAGKVESGVAFKLVMQPMVESIQSIRKYMADAEKEKMRVTVKMFNAYNPSSKIDLAKIRPTIVYNQNLIPVDEGVEIINDISLLAADVKSLPDLVMKYNPQFTTREQAEKFIEDVRAAKPKPEPVKSLRVRDIAKTNA